MDLGRLRGGYDSEVLPRRFSRRVPPRRACQMRPKLSKEAQTFGEAVRI
jgi:hypothetical protein